MNTERAFYDNEEKAAGMDAEAVEIEKGFDAAKQMNVVDEIKNTADELLEAFKNEPESIEFLIESNVALISEKINASGLAKTNIDEKGIRAMLGNVVMEKARAAGVPNFEELAARVAGSIEAINEWKLSYPPISPEEVDEAVKKLG
jgi:hypothetical protein